MTLRALRGLRVLAIPAHLEGSGYLRICAPAQAINALSNGQVHVDLAKRVPAIFTGAPGRRRVEQVAELDYDVVVLQTPMVEDVVTLIPALQEQGIAVVAEIDDCLDRTPQTNVNYAKVQPKTSPSSNWRWLKRGCALADLVTCSTPALRRYAGGETEFKYTETRIIPNAVPAAATNETKPDIPHTVVGWTGSVATHDTDLTVTGGAVARAVEETGAKFLSIGWWHLVREQLQLSAEPPSTGWLPLDQYYARIPYLDVGIVPLADSAFNRSKSCLKGIEYAAAGVPFVASPLPEYRALAADGLGWLAENAADWHDKTKQLITDHALRVDLSAAYRDTIRRTRTFETTWWRWAEAWQHAANIRGGVRATA